MRNKNDLLRWADVIRTQAEEGGNTADLVGGLLKEIINYIGESGQAVSPDIEDAIREAVSSALSSIISSGDGVIVVNGGGTSGGEDSGEDGTAVPATEYPTKVFVPEGKKILIVGASFSENGGTPNWVNMLAQRTGITVVNRAAPSSDVIGNLAARLMFRSATVGGTTKQMAYGLVFGSFDGSTYIPAFDEYGLLLINHVHNMDVFTLGKRGGDDVSEWDADDYESYFKVVEYDGVNPPEISSWSFLNEDYYYKTETNGTKTYGPSSWMVVPKGNSDTTAMTYAEAFDYSIKRIRSWIAETETFRHYDVPKNTLQFLITSHWNPGRDKYNRTSRQLAARHNIAYCALDKMLGFVEGDNVTYNGVECNRSRLFCSDTQDGKSDSVNKNWGVHPIKQEPWIQSAWAQAVISCLNYYPVQEIN